MSTRHERRRAYAEARYRESLRRAIWNATGDKRYEGDFWAWQAEQDAYHLRSIADRIGDKAREATE